jgi:hypothetical protein
MLVPGVSGPQQLLHGACSRWRDKQQHVLWECMHHAMEAPLGHAASTMHNSEPSLPL